MTSAAAPAPAPAAVQPARLGQEPEAAPSCPAKPCLALTKTTAYQAKVGTNRGLMEVKQDGRLVSWTVTLAKPGKKQIAHLDVDESHR